MVLFPTFIWHSLGSICEQNIEVATLWRDSVISNKIAASSDVQSVPFFGHCLLMQGTMSRSGAGGYKSFYYQQVFIALIFLGPLLGSPPKKLHHRM